MSTDLHPSDARLFAQLQEAFGLNQTSLGRLLGLSRAMMSAVRRGKRYFPLAAAEPFARLLLALDKLPAPSAMPAAPDAAGLERQQRACRATAMRLALELTAMQARAAWAGRRLAALPTLTATLPAGEPLPRWLTAFEAEARETLAACGALPQARLALRRSALLHEAAQVGRLLAGASLSELDA
jgi:transcriptional regulator with XRE-family HTH domain